jgi:hypothetical protein
MYVRTMTIAFLANGLGIFGLKVLSASGLGNTDAVQYLMLWYLSGALLGAIAYFSGSRGASVRELLIGAAMAAASLCGQLAMAGALSGGLPGYVVFPVATGGGLLFVVAVGVGVFRERMGSAGYLGIAVGTVALILLALP